MSEKIIEVKDLTKSYGYFKAVDKLNLNVYRGDVYGFLGPNGAGKSTTIRMMLSLIRPDSGEIKYFNKSLSGNRSDILRRVGSIVEKPDFYKYLSARKNLDLLGRLAGVNPSKSKIFEVLELVGLKGREDDPAKNYSHGMKQRLGLAQALLHNPDLIILDEPTTGLDPQGIIDLRNLIHHLTANLGKTIVLSSHILSEIELIATRMVIIDKGKAIVEGNVHELLDSSALVVSFTIPDEQRALSLINQSQWKNKLASSGNQHIIFNLSSGEIAELNFFLCQNNIAVNGIESRKKLEDYFLSLMSKN